MSYFVAYEVCNLTANSSPTGAFIFVNSHKVFKFLKKRYGNGNYNSLNMDLYPIQGGGRDSLAWITFAGKIGGNIKQSILRTRDSRWTSQNEPLVTLQTDDLAVMVLGPFRCHRQMSFV